MGRIGKGIVLGILFFLLFFSFTGFLNAETLSFTFKAGTYKIITLPDGYQKIEMEGFGLGGSPGNPELPSRIYNIALPPLTDFEGLALSIENAQIEELPGTYNIKPAPPWAIGLEKETKIFWGEGKNIVDGKNMNVYGKDEKFPKEFVVLLPYSQMRKWKFTRILFYPFQYNPVTKKLYLIKSVKIALNYSQISQNILLKESLSFYRLLEDRVMDREASQIISNFSQALRWYEEEKKSLKSALRSIPLIEEKFSYVIITTNAIRDNSTKLGDFVTHLQNFGYSVKIITEDDFDSLAGVERADRIRKWLQNNYISMGIKYVLLIGNPDPNNPEDGGDLVGNIPMKMCWPRYEETFYRESPTDYYYADLTGNWDLDGDGIYGEHNGDRGDGGVDFFPEVYVGRIPVYNNDYATLDNILQKIINYENASGDLSWRKKMLLPMAISNYENEDNTGLPRTDGRDLPKYVIENYLQLNGFSYYVFYEKEGLDPVPDTAPYDNPSHIGISEENVINEWNKGYGCVFWWGHGNSSGVFRKYWSTDDGDGVPESSEMAGASFFYNSDCSQLDDTKPSIVYQSSCLNGYPEDSDNLGYSLLKHGAVATVSASRVSWYVTGTWYPISSADNVGIGYYFFLRMIENSESAGQALFLAKSNLSSSGPCLWMNLFDFNLYGEPAVTFSLSPTSPWPMFHHDLQRIGRSSYQGPENGGLKWKYETGNTIVYSSPVIGRDGTIYIGSFDGYLYAIHSDGTLKWRYSTGDQINSPPAIGPDGTIYVGSRDNYLYAVNPDGTLKWRYQTGGDVDSSPAIGPDGTIYVGSDDYYLYAINSNGTLKWRYQTGGEVLSVPAVDSNGTIYVGSKDGYLYAINSDGTLKWHYHTGGQVNSTPAVGSDVTIYVGSRDNYLYAVNPDGTLKWRYQTGGDVDSSPAIGPDGTIYVGSCDGYLYAINPNGTLKWGYETGNIIVSSPAVDVNGTIYVGSEDNYLYAVNPDGTLKWRYQTGGYIISSPAIGSDGTIYVGCYDHSLYAISEIGRADLIVTTVSGPTSIVPGGSYRVDNTIKNQGTVSTSSWGSFNVEIYLSTDSTITTSDRKVGQRIVSSLDAGDSSSDSTPVNIPSDLPAGTYYWGAIVDSSGVIPESNENNNNKAGNQTNIVHLIAYYRFEEGTGYDTTLDSSGNGNDGTLEGGVNWIGVVPPKDGGNRAIKFDGATGKVTIPDKSIQTGMTELSIEAWVKPSALPNQQNTIVKKWQWGVGWGDDAYELRIENDGKVVFTVHDVHTGKSVWSTTTIPLNQWTHIAGVWDGTEAKIYINGVLDNTAPAQIGPIGDCSKPLTIGGPADEYNEYFQGIIDEVKIYSIARTDAEIAEDGNYSWVNILTNSLPDGSVGVLYSATLQKEGGLSPYTWSIVEGNLPPGLSLDSSTGEISGTPTQEGLYSFTVKLEDGYGSYTTKPLEIEIVGNIPNPPSNFSHSAKTQTSITWTWQDNSGNEDGFKIHDENDSTVGTVGANIEEYIESGLSPNTQYTRHVHAYNQYGDSEPSNSDTTYTLPKSPDETIDPSDPGSYPPGTTFVFRNIAGWGEGNLAHYHYVWDTSPTYDDWTGDESVWNSGDLSITENTPGTYYLHVMSHNSEDGSGGTADYGPYIIEGVPDIDVSPTSHDFGTVDVGNHQDWSGLTISNTGTDTLTVSSIASDNSDFSVISPSFPQDITAGNSINVTVRFAPSSVGLISGQLTINSNDPDENPVYVDLSGTGGGEPDIDVNPLSYDFGTVDVGNHQDWSGLTISNTGNAALRVESITSDNSDFSIISPSFPQDITAGNSINVTVRFAPSSVGLISGQLTINSNDPDENPAYVDLSGTGGGELPGIAIDLDPEREGIQSSKNVILDEIFDADIIAQDVTNLDTFDFKLVYDSTKLEVISEGVTEGPFLSSLGGTTFFQKDLTQPGVVWLTDSLAGNNPDEAPDGTGVIAHVRFQVIDGTTGDTSSLEFSEAKYWNSDNIELSPVPQNGTIIWGIPGDFNGDGYVDVYDLIPFADHWHFRDDDPGWDSLYNLDSEHTQDGHQIIDVYDLIIFADHWHEGTPPQ